MVIVSNYYRWVGAIVCMGTLWLAAGQTRGDVSGEPRPTPQSPAPIAQPPAAAELAAPATDGFWSSGNDGEYDLPGTIGSYHDNSVWFRADYLLWWTTGARLPPLVTTSPPGTAFNDAGVLGVPGTTVLFGDQVVDGDARSGFRTTLGVWLDEWQHWAFEFDYFSPGGRSASFNETSNGDPILSRPFFDVHANGQSASIAAYPGIATGTVTANASDYFQSFGLSVSHCLCDYRARAPLNPESLPSDLPFVSSFRLDLLGAFRYYGLTDSVTVGENLVFANYLGLQNVNVVSLDSFRAENGFFGGEIGLRSQMNRGRWSLEVLGKLALGNNHRLVNIRGATAITPPGQPTSLFGFGSLATSSNIGEYTQDAFTVIPALGVELGYRWNFHWRTYFGYELIYWNQVARAGDQIDLNLDQSGTGLSPVFPNRTTSFLTQGLSFGVEFRL
jgi:hypothetical protein